jgi:DNA-binding response OmpR family regulator
VLSDHDVTITKDGAEAIQLLNTVKYDQIFLDHDLGDVEYDGVDVARVIPTSINQYTEVIIHSLNPIGANRMHGYIYYDGGNSKVMIAPIGSFTI